MEPGVVVELVRGVPMRVYADRPRSLLAIAGVVLGREARDFLVCGDRRVTDHQLLGDAQAVAAALQARGLEPGERVAILGANSVEWTVAFWGVVAAGGVVSALNGWWAPDEIAYALGHSRPRFLVVDAERLARLSADGGARAAIGGLDAVFSIGAADADGGDASASAAFGSLVEDGRGLERRAVPVDEDDPVAIFYTSGTTGRSKGAVATHRSWIAAVQSLQHVAAGAGATPPADRLPEVGLATLPLFHVSGCQAVVVAALVGGTRTVMLPGRFDPERAMAAIETERVTRWSAVPTMVSRVCRHEARSQYDLSSMRSISYGGSPAPPELPALVRATFPNVRSVGNAYGLTESGTVIAVNAGPGFEARPRSVGRPFPIIEVRIGAPLEDSMPAAEGEPVPGPIELRGPMIMPGYWDDPQATAEILSADGWLATGDLGYVDEDGFLYVTDRAKDVIIRGGENVYPAEIEQRLGEHPEVVEAAVVGVSHEDLGEAVEAHVRLIPSAIVTDAELGAFVAEALAAFKVPASWVRVAEPLPRNATGKLLKNEIRTGRVRG